MTLTAVCRGPPSRSLPTRRRPGSSSAAAGRRAPQGDGGGEEGEAAEGSCLPPRHAPVTARVGGGERPQPRRPSAPDGGEPRSAEQPEVSGGASPPSPPPRRAGQPLWGRGARGGKRSAGPLLRGRREGAGEGGRSPKRSRRFWLGDGARLRASRRPGPSRPAPAAHRRARAWPAGTARGVKRRFSPSGSQPGGNGCAGEQGLRRRPPPSSHGGATPN